MAKSRAEPWDFAVDFAVAVALKEKPKLVFASAFLTCAAGSLAGVNGIQGIQ